MLNTLLYLDYPSWLSPEIFPGLPLRWYSLSYIVAILCSYFVMRVFIKQEKLGISAEKTQEIVLLSVISMLLGGRIGSILFYNFSWSTLLQPWLIFWPFNSAGSFVGFQGMSYHGAIIGIIIGVFIYARVKKESFWFFLDLLAISAPLGYTFGRLGNFANGELFGRITASPVGMIFPQAPLFSLQDKANSWLSGFLEQSSIETLPGQLLVNLPRHASQLYEATFEGVLLWLVLWFVLRHYKRAFPGFLTGCYLIGYGIVRFFIEYFREPDAHLGFILELAPQRTPYTISLLNFSMGQVLCLLMIASGTLILLIKKGSQSDRFTLKA